MPTKPKRQRKPKPRIEIAPEALVLAVDPALRSGLAIGSQSRGLIASTVIDAHTGATTYVGRAMKLLAVQAQRWVRGYGPTIGLLAYEMPTMHSKHRDPLPQWAMVSALVWTADELGCWRFAPYWPTSVKARAAGHGKADKSDMIAAASRWAERAIDDDNEADAVLLLKLALEDLRAPQQSQAEFEFSQPKRRGSQ